MSRHILIGHSRATEFLRERPFPQTGQELLEAALDAHYVTFENGDPNIAGSLRRQPVWYGRGGHGCPNFREGAPYEDLERLLTSFTLGPLPTTVLEAGWWGADFLRRFFSIHPFLDGNGRVARLLMTRGIEDAGTLVVYGDHSRQSRRYLSSLEYAHRHAGRESRKNCLLYLARYVGDLVIATDELDDVMEWADFEDLGLDFDQELVPGDFVDDGDE